MTKKMISIFAILLLLGTPTMIIADEAIPGSTTEWLEESDGFSDDGCFCG
jgi:hypothetical protein